MDVIKEDLARIRVPGSGDKVFKDECLYSFDSPESQTGLYICLNRFLGVGERFLERYSKRTDNRAFLHIKRTKKEDEEKEVPEKVSRLAINMEGGFSTESKDQWVETTRVVVWPAMQQFELTDPDLPLQVQLSVAGILSAVSATKQAQVDAASGTWDGEALMISKHAENLVQNPNPPVIPPSGWKCANCDLTNNLWLNLTDGMILCGRKNFDGSGGNNHALEHYKSGDGKGPLAVKLGTIAGDGKGDVYSYDEDDMVLDPHLEKHLAHFGIMIGSLTKTDKSMVELEIEMNEKIGEWAVLTESGIKLTPLWGPGKTGIHNLGNTCYMNSVMQVLFSVQEVVECYTRSVFLERCDLQGPDSDFKLQMAKLCQGLVSGDYSKGTEEFSESVLREEGSQPGVKPLMLKNLIGKGHREFTSNRQQDAQEYYLYLLTMMERAHNKHEVNSPGNLFKFSVEDRLECAGQVKYKLRDEFFLPFNIPLESAANLAEMQEFLARKAAIEATGDRIPAEEEVRYKIPFESILSTFLGESLVEDVFSPLLQAKVQGKQTTRLKTFPDYLLISLSKYQVDMSWKPVKLNVEVDMPEELDLSVLRGSGLQPDEVPISEAENKAEEEEEVFENNAIVSELMEFGFSKHGCMRAVHHTRNTGVDAAMAWVMEHMEDPDFNLPFNRGGSSKAEVAISEENIAAVESMGFTAEMARTALRNTDNNLERAVEWIFSHPEGEVAPAVAEPERSSTHLTDGVPRYTLKAFISHMGSSTQCGHYVCHIKDEGINRWVIHNDNKVAVSEKPPKEFGYLYLYKRS